MTYATSPIPKSLCFLLVGALAGGCIISEGDGDGGTGGGDGADDGTPTTTNTPDDGVDDDPTGVIDDTGGSSDGEIPLPCGTNILSDPGFEAGTPSAAWTEASDAFGSPICDAGCTTDPGASPLEGTWWVWFGGLEEPEIASVSQSFNATATSAELQFAVSINAASGTGMDVMQVHIDDDEMWSVTDADMDLYNGYTAVTIDISQYADGADHTVTFSANLAGIELTNFFLDSTSVAVCDGGVDSGTDTSVVDESSSGDSGSSGGSSSGSGSGTGSGSSDSGSGSGSSDSGSGSGSSSTGV